jgi:DNA-binding NtrC family response regulator
LRERRADIPSYRALRARRARAPPLRAAALPDELTRAPRSPLARNVRELADTIERLVLLA